MNAYTLSSSQSGMKASLNSLLWALVAISGIVQIATGLFHDIGPPAVQAATLALPVIAFAFAHGSVVYGWRDITVFALICLTVSNAIENLNILTGLPSGHYHYTDLLGPKLFLVPVVIGPAYFGVGYLAWMLARLVLGDAGERRPPHATFTVPLVASFAMVAWNLSFDALYATVRQFWIWKDGGSYFGVPIANSFGWLLTTYLFFQALRALSPPSREWPSRRSAAIEEVLVAAGDHLRRHRRDGCSLRADDDHHGACPRSSRNALAHSRHLCRLCPGMLLHDGGLHAAGSGENLRAALGGLRRPGMGQGCQVLRRDTELISGSGPDARARRRRMRRPSPSPTGDDMQQPCRISRVHDLERRVEERARAPADASYTRALLDRGVEHCAKKLGEESIETVIAAVHEDRARLIAEAADLLYHLLVLLKARGIALSTWKQCWRSAPGSRD